jgi:hypothetical protein
LGEVAMAQAFDREPQDQPRLAASPWGDVSYWLALVATFAAGVFVSTLYRGNPLLHDYAMLFVALGALSLGFGAGILIYRRRQGIEVERLRTDYAELSKRAAALVNAAEQLERRRSPER